MYEIYHETPILLFIASQAIVQSGFLSYWTRHNRRAMSESNGPRSRVFTWMDVICHGTPTFLFVVPSQSFLLFRHKRQALSISPRSCVVTWMNGVCRGTPSFQVKTHLAATHTCNTLSRNTLSRNILRHNTLSRNTRVTVHHAQAATHPANAKHTPWHCNTMQHSQRMQHTHCNTMMQHTQPRAATY